MVGAMLLLPFVVLVGFLFAKHWVAQPPTHAACVAQADHRIVLHREGELPSIAAGIAATRDDMIQTCERHWSRIYVDCIIDAPTLVAVEACEKTGRAR